MGYEDIVGSSNDERRRIGKARWDDLPAVLKDSFDNSPQKSMYEALRKLNVDAKPTRTVEWCYPTKEGGVVVTIWHDHIQRSPEGRIVYYIPIRSWLGHGSQPARAERLGTTLSGVVGQRVRALLLRHEWDANGTQFAKAIAIDQRSWLVEQLTPDEFLLWRGGKGSGD